jgi:uncharacterized protein YndB with AHSA1/START domain
MSDDGVLEVSVHIQARPGTVFSYFTDAARYVAWMGTQATIEARPEGAYRVRLREGMISAGRFVEIDAPRRVVFTFGWDGADVVMPGSTRVEVMLTPDGQSGTDVVLRHFALPNDDEVQHHRQGWERYLGRLAIAACGGDPGPDPNA